MKNIFVSLYSRLWGLWSIQNKKKKKIKRHTNIEMKTNYSELRRNETDEKWSKFIEQFFYDRALIVEVVHGCAQWMYNGNKQQATTVIFSCYARNVRKNAHFDNVIYMCFNIFWNLLLLLSNGWMWRGLEVVK